MHLKAAGTSQVETGEAGQEQETLKRLMNTLKQLSLNSSHQE